jgi:hypothetical protein
MKTLAEISAEKLQIQEVLRRVGRLAWGADGSQRYARELHDWLADRFRADERFSDLLRVLRDYRSKVGQVEASQTGRDLIERIRFDIEGLRFPWKDVPEDKGRQWMVAFARSDSPNVEGDCPACGASTLRRYYRVYHACDSQQEAPDKGELLGRGALWEWCRSCFCYMHYQASVPASWLGPPELERIPMELLEHSPEFLERGLREGELSSAPVVHAGALSKDD